MLSFEGTVLCDETPILTQIPADATAKGCVCVYVFVCICVCVCTCVCMYELHRKAMGGWVSGWV